MSVTENAFDAKDLYGDGAGGVMCHPSMVCVHFSDGGRPVKVSGLPKDAHEYFDATIARLQRELAEARKIADHDKQLWLDAVAKLAVAVDALYGVDIYGSDTLEGRSDGPNDATWYRDGVEEMRDRARAALAQIKGDE